MRSVVRSTLIAGLTGTLMVSAAWAGIGIAPVPVPSLPSDGVQADAEGGTATGDGGTGDGGAPALAGGQLLVGAAKTSIAPRPDQMQDRFPGAVWETDPAKCKTTEPAWFQDLPTAAVNALDGIANPGSVWPENPNCIYQGGFGLGPLNPVNAFDEEFGLWVRSMAISDGSQTIITTVVDGEGWLWDYKSKCTDCGAKQIAAALAADEDVKSKGVGVTPASHILHATHSHAAPDFIGGWGFVPNWYMAQVTDTIKATAKQAVLTMQAATLETGEQEARAHNSERRDTYRSAEEGQISWLRAVAVNTTPPPAEPTTEASAPTAVVAPAAVVESPDGKEKGGKKPSPSVSPSTSTSPSSSPSTSTSPSSSPSASTSPSPGVSPSATPAPSPAPAQSRVIATLGAFAAHPVTYGGNDGVAHPDWVGLFNKRLEERFGGIGMHFMTGLGNLTGANRQTGGKLADLIPAVGDGRPVDDTTVKIDQVLTRSALTNVPLTALGTPGLFDRKFDVQPAVVSVGDGDVNTLDGETLTDDEGMPEPEPQSPCVSTSPQSVELPATAARIGNDIVLTAAPGEVFANYTNTIKEKNAGRITFPLAQSNDALGYMPQSFEIHPVGQQGLGFVAGGMMFVNYEDSYAIDRCTGDLLLEETLALLATVKG